MPARNARWLSYRMGAEMTEKRSVTLLAVVMLLVLTLALVMLVGSPLLALG